MNVNVCKWVLTPPAATVLRFLGGLSVSCKINKCFFFSFFLSFLFYFQKIKTDDEVTTSIE